MSSSSAEDHFQNSSEKESPCSKYMDILQNQIDLAKDAFFMPLSRNRFAPRQVRELSARLIQYFIRHVCLLRPVGEGGKLQLTSDMTQLELAIGALQRVEDLGPAYVALRTLKPFMFLDNEKVVESVSDIQAIGLVNVIHLLFARAPEDMLSPHTVRKMSPAKYSDMLDRYADKELVGILRGTLDFYVSDCAKRQVKQYAEVYPIIKHLLDSCEEYGVN